MPSNNLFGFLKEVYTSKDIYEFVDRATESLNKNCISIALLIDLVNAFDTVSNFF